MAKKLFTPEFDLECTLELTENLRVRDGLARLVILDHRRLLVNLLRQVLLRELKLCACVLDSLILQIPVSIIHNKQTKRMNTSSVRMGRKTNLANSGQHFWRWRNLVFTVKLGNALVVGP